VSEWPATKASRVLAALLRIGWRVKRQSGPHRVLAKEGYTDFVFAWHDRDEVRPALLRWIGRQTGLRPEDL
jgi:predicted RNA binding protein YcfA (HicA-like mRNA interferase family)